jgi:hypothetical protein
VSDIVIHLHRQAPPKPAEGEPCNGCGVCCALATCPLARLRFLRKTGPCPALLWVAGEARYRCGMLLEPRRFLGFVPARWVARRIAAGAGCDCSAEADYGC